MKILIFGDIHGNLIALEKMLAIEKNNVDAFICHGDIVNYAPFSEECLDLITSLPNCQCLKGNHETYFIEGVYPGVHPVAKAFFDFCYPKFNPKKIEVLNTFKEEVSAGEYNVKHTLESKYIFQDTVINEINIKKPHIIGHSHQQYTRTHNTHKLINTGSLGQNREHINKSDYVILNTLKNTVELKSFSFPIDKLIHEMERLNYPEICLNYYKEKNRI